MNKPHVMRGLILKDWYGLRSYLVRQMGLVLAMYVVLGFAMKTMSMLPSMMVMVTMMGMLSAFSLDDMCHWNGYACTMNITARQLARARYAMYYGAMACVTLVSAVLAYGLELLLFAGGQSNAEIFLAGFGGGAAVLVIYSLMVAVDIPLFYKMGVEKARLPMTLTFVVPFIAIFPTISYWGPWLDDLNFDAVPWVLVAAAVLALVAACVYLSYRISVRILESKEF